MENACAKMIGMCKTIKQKIKFKAPPNEVYRVLADSRARSAATGRKAELSRRVGGAFSTDDGRVTGVMVDLAPGRRLVQAWRRNDFPEGIYSMATFTLTPTRDGGTELVLTHRGVPKTLIDGTEDDWRAGCWAKMKDYLTASRRA
jgi:uncharacterized protein YndB with AHSA1/START domain